MAADSGRFDLVELVLAMASVDRVLDGIESKCISTLRASSDSEEELSVKSQDSFALLIRSCWEQNEFGPSKRYLQSLVKRYVRRVGDDSIQSVDLMLLLLDMFSDCVSCDMIPDPNEHCYLAFRIHQKNARDEEEPDRSPPLLRIRIFPFHNDLSLRLWEGGATLAEYLVENPDLVENRNVVELGSGVGLTGLIAAGCCGAKHVCSTDYTASALENLRYNRVNNTEWLKYHHHRCRRCHHHHRQRDTKEAGNLLSEAYLDWSSVQNNADKLPAEELQPGLADLSKATVLLAADVAYDISVIPDLAQTVLLFFTSSDIYAETASSCCYSHSTKRAIFAMTLRNEATFDKLQQELSRIGISNEVVASGSDCDSLPRLFPTKFWQPRSDVKIFSLTIVPAGQKERDS